MPTTSRKQTNKTTTTDTTASTLVDSSTSPVFIGLDWADTEHALCLITPDGQVLHETLTHDPQAIADWVESLQPRFSGRSLCVALEQSRGALFGALIQFDDLELYPINPSQLASYREAITPSRSKSDPGDACLLAQFLRHHHAQLRPWRPDDDATRLIRELSELRRQLVDQRTALLLTLISQLKLYFPLILKLAGGNGRSLNTPLFLDLLRRWPKLNELQRVHPKTLRTFLAEHGLKNADQQTEFINAVRGARPLTSDASLIEARALYVHALVQQVRELNQALTQFEERLQQVVAKHPDEPIFRSLPGAGDVLVPRLIAAFGADRQRYESAAQVQCYSGIAPITQASGKSRHVRKRQACPKFLRQTFHEFADHARKWSRWAKAYYDMKRAQGVKHHAAIRALAYTWIRIIFRMWQTHTPYSEETYLQQLQKTNSPLLKSLEQPPAA